MKKFIFDVDGTLTPSRKRIDPKFETFFLDFCSNNKVYIVTGSDHPKTLEQLGEHILKRVQVCFNCAGNEVWQNEKIVSKESWEPSQEIISYLENLLEKSKFPIRTGNHIEIRNGMLNFCIPGRNSNGEQRQQYIEWDKSTSERLNLIEKIKNKFGNVIDSYVGGETGIDIFPSGSGKKQVISKIKTKPSDILYYFGDQVFENGNDYDAAILCNHYYNVRDWSVVHEMLSYFIEARVCK